MDHGAHIDLGILAISVCVSIFASFTALNLSGRLMAAEPRARRWWILAAAFALGGGTWSMHFLGMLAMPIPETYDAQLTALSLLLPVVASALGFQITARSGPGWRPLSASGLLVGAGISAMHYTGMAAIRTPGLTAVYNPRFVAASIAVAIFAAISALWLAFRTHGIPQRLAASVAMGIAISGMHYVAMAGVTFDVSHLKMVGPPSIPPAIVALAVACATSLLMLLGLVTAYFDRALATLTAREADALTASEKRYRAMIESTSDLIGLVDRDGAFIYENSSASRVLGYTSEDLIGRWPTEFVAPEAEADTRQFFRTCLDRPGLPTTMELPLLAKDGRRHEFEVVATNFLDVPAVGGVVLNLRDITERKQMIERLEILSETDLLTGALNRRGFVGAALGEFERMRRQGDRLMLALIDIDHFKAVNDNYGHAAGDLVLAAVADCCRRETRECDIFARHGGEEFAILVTEGDVAGAHAMVERLRRAIAATRVSAIKAEISVTASFGVALVDPFYEGLESALARADEALYEAKNAGRDCIRISA
jgi:diguanylate cyclase (GGDEF)-like protein/PAS domain S-box-containing protein